MTSSYTTTECEICQKERKTYMCTGCSKYFCIDDLRKHDEELKAEFHEIEDQRNDLVENLNDCRDNTTNHSLFKQINRWEQTSIEKIRQTANKQRELVQQAIQEHAQRILMKLNMLTKEMRKIGKTENFNEIVLNKLRIQFQNLKKQLNQTNYIEVKEDSSSSYIKKLSIRVNSIKTTGKFIYSIFIVAFLT